MKSPQDTNKDELKIVNVKSMKELEVEPEKLLPDSDTRWYTKYTIEDRIHELETKQEKQS